MLNQPPIRIVCVIFVLLEVAVLSILFYVILLPIYEDSLFDRTLKLRGLRHVLKANEGNDMAKCMRGVGGGLWILLFQVSCRLLSLFSFLLTSTQPRFEVRPLLNAFPLEHFSCSWHSAACIETLADAIFQQSDTNKQPQPQPQQQQQ